MRESIFSNSDYKIVTIPPPTTPPAGQFPSGAYPNAPVHNGVQYRADKFKGSKVWMVNSPYPGDDDYENPCVWFSKDTEYPATEFNPYSKNPIRGKNGAPDSLSFNSDPDICIANNELYVINREHWRGTDVVDNQLRLEMWMYKGIFSGDVLTDFTDAVKIYDGYGTDYTGTNIPNYVSPSLVHDGEKFIIIDLVTGSWNSAAPDQECKKIRINTSVHLSENCFQTGWSNVSFSGYKIEPWHMQVFSYMGKFYAIVCATVRGFNGTDSGRVYLGEFTADFKTLYIHGRSLTDFRAYRSSAYVDENGLFVLYANSYNQDLAGGVNKRLYVTSLPFQDVLNKVKG